MGVKEFYEKMYGDGRPNQPKLSLYRASMKRLIDRFGISRYELTYRMLPGGDSILDIGCGEDLTQMPLWGKYREVYGVDISTSRIKRMQEQFGNNPNIHLIVADVNEKLSFKDSSFDTIIAVAVIEHIFDPYHLMREAYRLLKPGGYIIVQVPNVALLGNRLRLLMGQLPVTSAEQGWDGGHLHYFTKSSLKRLFLHERFKIEKITSGGVFARLGKPWSILSSLLDGDILIAGSKK